MKHSQLRALVLAMAFGTVMGSAVSAQQVQQTPVPPPGQASAPAPIEPKALEIIQAACKVLSDAKTMTFTAVNTYQKAALNGQPLYYATRNEVALQRPDKLRVITPGDGMPDKFYYDGKTMTAYVPSEDLVAVGDAPPTIDQMIDAAWDTAAVYFPFSDVIVSDPCVVFADQMKSAFYVGRSSVVAGTTTDMVAVAGDAGGYAHGSAANSQGVPHASDYGGYYHGTTATASGAVHTTGYGTTSVNGVYYQAVPPP